MVLEHEEQFSNSPILDLFWGGFGGEGKCLGIAQMEHGKIPQSMNGPEIPDSILFAYPVFNFILFTLW